MGSKGRPTNQLIPRWLWALLLIFVLCIIGLGVNLFIGESIPFYLLLGFSCIYSVEKWFGYITKTHKAIGVAYRLLLNLCILSLFGLIIWSGLRLFSQQFHQNPLIGSFVFLAEFVLFIWMWKVISRNSWRQPSMKLTTLSLIAITTVFTFAGVQPMAGCKDTLINKWDTYSAEQKAKTEERLAQKRLEEQQTLAKAEERLEEQNRITEQRAIEENRLEQERIEQTIVMAERLAFNLINNERVITGLSPTIWDDSLYQLSKAHTQEMANQKQLFHSDINAPIGEDAWGGFGYSRKSGEELAQAIVNSWMSSPLHKAWILNTTFQHSVVSIVSDTNGQYASWTFWRSEVGDAPPLIRKASALYQAETGGSIPWLTWLHDIKGYPNNPDFLRELGIK